MVAAIVLPIILLPIHFFFLVLSILTTVLAGAFLSWRAFVVYLEIGMDTLGRIYTDIFKGRSTGRRRRDLLKKAVLEREDAVKAAQNYQPRARGRGLTIA